MMDTNSGSFWSHVTGEALWGELEGSTLKTIPVVQTTWKEWKDTYPETGVLKKSAEIRSSSYESYFRNPDRKGLFRTKYLRDLLPGKTLVHGIQDGIYALAVSDQKIEAEKIVHNTLGDEKIIFVRAEDGVHAYKSTPHLIYRDSEGKFYDEQTKSGWDPESGTFTAGELKGETLEQLQVTVAFWFAWSSFFPNTALVK